MKEEETPEDIIEKLYDPLHNAVAIMFNRMVLTQEIKKIEQELLGRKEVGMNESKRIEYEGNTDST